MIRVNSLKLNIDYSNDDLQKTVAKHLNISKNDLISINPVKLSLDARKKPEIYQIYSVGLSLKNASQEEKLVSKIKNNNIIYQKDISFVFDCAGEKKMEGRPVIIGMGPAGLFCGYMLAQNGYRPIILERGQDVDTRTNDVNAFWNGGKLNPESNVQFGEGGAGTFSDGKLNTLIKDKDGRNKKVLEIFVECGAPEEILFVSKPHIGTDILKIVVKNMREKIIEYGGEVKFGAKVTDILVNDGNVSGDWPKCRVSLC